MHRSRPLCPRLEPDPGLLDLVAHIKTLPRNPANIIPATRDLAVVVKKMTQGNPDQALLDALDAAEQELRAINRADDRAEGLTPQRNRW